MRRVIPLFAATSIVAAAMSVLPVVATVAPAEAAAVRDQTLSGVDSPLMWQTDDPVTSVVYSRTLNRVFAAGTFTTVRPPGVDEGGAGEVARDGIASFNATTGALDTAFSVDVAGGGITDLALSSGGTSLFLGGSFTTVDGQPRQGIASVDAASGALRGGFTANANDTVTALVVRGSDLYASGRFTTVNGTAKTRLARMDASTGAVVTGFTASLDGPARALDLAPVTTSTYRLLVGGSFTSVNGTRTGGMTSVDPGTGVRQSWAANADQPINTRCAGRITDITHDASVPATVVVSGEGDPPGCWEGTYAASVDGGTLLWNSSCVGAAQAVAVIGSVVYKGSHQHECAYTRGDARGGYVGSQFTNSLIHYNLQAQSVSDGSFQHWTPATNSGATTGNGGAIQVGPRALATDGSKLFVGGDFTQVNGVNQQGLAMFAPGGSATPERPTAPTVRPTKAGTLTVTWPATYDADSGTLTYRLYRGTTLIYTTTAESWPWTRPTMRFDDTRAAGQQATYYVTASDGTRTSVRSTGTAGTASATRPAGYDATTAFLDPVLYYRMDSTADSSGNGNPMVSTGTSSTRPTTVTGAVDQGTGKSLTGGAYLTSSASLAGSAAYSLAVWFRTTGTSGGTLMAMSTQQTGSGGTSDRGIVVDNNGNLVFQIQQQGGGTLGIRQQERSFRDGRWHLAVATYDGTSGRLYVDGEQLAALSVTPALSASTRTWPRIGYVNTTGFRSTWGTNYDNVTWPATNGYNGLVDDAAVYDKALTGADVNALFGAGVSHPSSASTPGTTPPGTTPPGTTAPAVASSCFGRKATIVARNGGVVRGTKKADVIIVASNRRSAVRGKGGNDRICGSNDVRGGKGDDKISFRGGSGVATLRGGAGDDTIKGGAGDDVLSGGKGRDVVRGGKGDDRISGGPSADRLFGNSGDDALTGGPGRDFGNGGPGTDTCRGVERRRSCP